MKVALLLVTTVFVVQLSSAIYAAEPAPPASPGEHLARVFGEVSRENRGVDKDHKRIYSSSWDFTQHFATWPAGGPSMRSSLALEALVAELTASGGDARDERRAEAYVKAAAVWWNDPNPKRRAFAAEFMARLPLPTLESGVIAKLVPLLGDTTVAWSGLTFGMQQWAQPTSVHPVEVTVGNVAAATLRSMTPFEFDDADTFRRWWEANQELRPHPWYWSMRWRTRPATADLDTLAALGPDQGLRVLLLASNPDALLADARRSAGPQLKSVANIVPDSQLATALFVRKHGLNHRLLDLLEGEIPWLEAKEPSAQRSLLNRAITVLEQTYTPGDLPRLRQILAAPQGLLGTDQQLLLTLTRAAIRWLPSEHESILVSLLKKDLGNHVLAVELLEATGLIHWELIKQSYAVGGQRDGRHTLIRAVPFPEGTRARQCLGELLAMDQLEAVERLRDARQLRFQAFVEAANDVANRPLISKGELDDAIYYSGKGGDRREADVIAAGRQIAAPSWRSFAGSSASPLSRLTHGPTACDSRRIARAALA